MSALSIARTATELAVSMGAGAVVGNAIKRSIPGNAKLLQKISIGVGGFVLSGMVGELAVKYTNDNIDKGLASFNAVKDGIVKIEAETVEKVADKTDEPTDAA